MTMTVVEANKEMTPTELLKRRPRTLQTFVRSITYQGEDINAYELVPPLGSHLPPFTAGAHVDLYFRDGRIRQYSLCNDPAEPDRYLLAIQCEKKGRGGSKAIFEKIHVGRRLVISEPRNNFSLASEAKRHVLIAGGIGVTPIMSMIHTLSRSNADFEVHYCTRSAERTAFQEELSKYKQSQKIFFYHDGGDPSRGANFIELLAKYIKGTHLYCCGPLGLIRAVENASSHWPTNCVHRESFTAASDQLTNTVEQLTDGDRAIPVGFQIAINSSGAVYDVPPDKTILEVLKENGFDIPSSCEAGLCGTCRLRFLKGEPDHRDYILKDSEKNSEILVCCSRSKSPLLVLDL